MRLQSSAKELFHFTGLTDSQLEKLLISKNIPYLKKQKSLYLDPPSVRSLLQLPIDPQIIAVQVVKGGTGKTTVVSALALKACLYGLKVLCIDLDQQANLTQAFRVNAEQEAIMIDVIDQNLPIMAAVCSVMPNLDLIPSRVDNAMLNEILSLKNVDLHSVYAAHLVDLKSNYDLILIDCPPSLDKSTAAAALCADWILAPVVLENFALSGLEITLKMLQELGSAYMIPIQVKVLLNKYNPRTKANQAGLDWLWSHPLCKDKILNTPLRLSQEFPNAVSENRTIFQRTGQNFAKLDVENLLIELLNLREFFYDRSKRPKQRGAVTRQLRSA